MRVLITGASGFLGRHVLERLRQHHHEAVALGRQPPSGSAAADFIEADLLDVADLSGLVKQARATHLLHLAWYAEHGRYWTSPLNLRWVESTIRLVEAFCDAGGRQVVVAGSCAEYDWTHGYCREDTTPLNPATLYGVAKDSARRLVTAIAAGYGVPCAWGRIFQPFGAGEDPRRLIPSLIGVFRRQREPFGVNAAAYRDFLHASDVAEGFVTLLASGRHDVFNISSGEPVRVGDVVAELARLTDSDPQPVLVRETERPGEPPLLVGESLKLRALGWQPALSLVQALQRTVQDP